MPKKQLSGAAILSTLMWVNFTALAWAIVLERAAASGLNLTILACFFVAGAFASMVQSNRAQRDRKPPLPKSIPPPTLDPERRDQHRRFLKQVAREIRQTAVDEVQALKPETRAEADLEKLPARRARRARR